MNTLIRRGNYVNPQRLAELRKSMTRTDSNRRRTYIYSTEVSLDAIRYGSLRLNTSNQWLKVHGTYVNLTHYGIGSEPDKAWQAYRVNREELLRIIEQLQANPLNRGNTTNGVLELLDKYTNADIRNVDAVVVGPSGER